MEVWLKMFGIFVKTSEKDNIYNLNATVSIDTSVTMRQSFSRRH